MLNIINIEENKMNVKAVSNQIGLRKNVSKSSQNFVAYI